MAGIPGLGDRGAMEKERLARLAARNQPTGAKRERSESPPALSRPTKTARIIKQQNGEVQKTNETSESPEILASYPVVPQVIDLDSPSPPAAAPSSQAQTGCVPSASIKPTSTSSSTNLEYPHGTVKKTWAFGHPRTSSDIKIEEVLEKNSLRTAILSAFQWDTEWVFSKVNMNATKLIFIMQAKEQALRDQMLAETADLRKSLRLLFPPMEGQVNCMHSKLILLFHPHKLRVVVPSANLMKYDWGETGVMENSVFLIDLPRLPESMQMSQNTLTPFGEELLYFLEQQGLDDVARNSIRNFDFATTRNMAFVHSSGGVAYGSDLQRTGFMGLNKAVRELDIMADTDLQIDFCASSIGSLNDDLLKALHSAARGEALLPPSASKSLSKKMGAQASTVALSVRDNFRIYFPTLETVANSTGGVDNGGTICLQRKWWEGLNAFPRECFRDSQSVREGLLSHCKILFARGLRKDTGAKMNQGVIHSQSFSTDHTKKDENPGDDIAWAYIGSANMSESAWGKLVWDRSRKEWKMNCRNWECGVLMKVPQDNLCRYEGGDGAKVAKEEGGRKLGGEKTEKGKPDDGKGEKEQKRKPMLSMDVFDGVVDVPFRYPGRDYEGREPWYFTEPH